VGEACAAGPGEAAEAGVAPLVGCGDVDGTPFGGAVGGAEGPTVGREVAAGALWVGIDVGAAVGVPPQPVTAQTLGAREPAGWCQISEDSGFPPAASMTVTTSMATTNAPAAPIAATAHVGIRCHRCGRRPPGRRRFQAAVRVERIGCAPRVARAGGPAGSFAPGVRARRSAGADGCGVLPGRPKAGFAATLPTRFDARRMVWEKIAMPTVETTLASAVPTIVPATPK
jgi:hypothetical protein